MDDGAAAVVEGFRDAALGLCAWEEALDGLGRMADAHMIQLSGTTSAHNLLINHSSGISTDQMQAYFAAGGPDPTANPRSCGMLSFAPLQCFTDREVLGASERSAHPIYRELFHPSDAFHSAQIRLFVSGGLDVGITMMRSKAAGEYERGVLGSIEHAGPGIGAAVAAALALGTGQDNTAVHTAETLGGAAILLGNDRTIVSLSLAAEDVVRGPVPLRIRSGRLEALDAIDDGAFDRAFRLASLAGARMARTSHITLRNGGTPLRLELHPLPRRPAGPLSLARVLLVMQVPPGSGIAAHSGLRETFDLSEGEARIAGLLAAGLSLREIAQRRGRSLSTIRSQLKAVFEKTGTHRQAELVSLLQRPAMAR